MKNLMILTAFLATSSAFAGNLILDCTLLNRQYVSLNIQSLDRASTGPESGYFQQPKNPVRYFVSFYPHAFKATGHTEAQNGQGEWVHLQDFSTDDSCELRRAIEVGCPGGRMDLCRDPGGHGNGRSTGGRTHPGGH